MAKVVRRENESLEGLMKRWKRKVNDEMILADIKKHESYLSKSQKRREKKKAAAAKRRKFERKQAMYEIRKQRQINNGTRFERK